MNLISTVQQRGNVAFPAFLAERVYMRAFTKAEGLPLDLARWQPTVDAMLDGVDTDGPIYLMVDQGVVKAGTRQRRPGVHIDGYWVGGQHWSQCEFSRPEALILASDVTACRAFTGEFTGTPGEGGDFSHLDLSRLQSHTLEAGKVYAGNVTMLHESLPVQGDVARTLVRLSVPGWEPRT